MAKLDEESEELHQKFLEKDIDLATFVQKYKKLRTAYHKQALLHLAGQTSLRLIRPGIMSTVNFVVFLLACSCSTLFRLKKQVKTLFRLICGERKTLFRLKKQAEKYRL